MFVRLYIGRLRCLLRDKALVFWTLLFPLLLGTLFYVGFGNLTTADESFSPVPVAVVDDAAYNADEGFAQTLEAVSKKGEGQLFLLEKTDAQSAGQLLQDGKVDGVLTASADGIRLTVAESGFNQTIIKSFLDEYAATSKTVTRLAAENPEDTPAVVAALTNPPSFTKTVSFSDAEPDMMRSYFFALIAMTALYGAFWGVRNILDLQANLSALGQRRCMAPTHKMTSLLADFGAALTIHFAELLVVLFYLMFVLRIDFGGQIGYILLTCLMGCLVGVSFGMFIGTVFRGGDGIKTAMVVGLSLLLSFLAGLMFVQMKYLIAAYVPILAWINPAALISDAFYALYVYESHTRFWLNMLILGGITVIFCGGSYLVARRQKYASL